MSDEGLPVKGATVGIIDLDLQTQTDGQGQYAFSDVRPGTYQLFVQKLGFEARAISVVIVIGEVTTSDLQLAAIAVEEARQVTVIWNSYMKCSAGIWNLGWSEECGEGLGTPVGTYGKDPNNKIDWHFSVTEVPKSILTETVWEPTQTTSDGMRVIIVKNIACEPVCDWDAQYADDEAASPVRLVVDGKDLEDEELPLQLTVRRWAALGTGPTDPVKLIAEQPFEVYKTEFFGVPIEDVDPEFSALPPK